MTGDPLPSLTGRADRPPRHYSGILVTAIPGLLDEARSSVAAQPGVEVRESDPATGRFVAVLETADRQGQEDGLRALSALASVASADLITHFIDDEESTPQSPEEEMP
ncbi:MAG: chaperone NapD [Acidobacteria bacterium]|nr:chaperone NapD [Acidobacteriota bacterium]